MSPRERTIAPFLRRVLTLSAQFPRIRTCSGQINLYRGEIAVLTMSVLSRPEQEGSTLDKRTDHRKALDRRRFERDCPGPQPDQRRFVVCSPRSWSELCELVEIWSSPWGAFAARKGAFAARTGAFAARTGAFAARTGAFAARTRKVDIFLSNHRRFRSNFAWARSRA